MHIQIAVLFLVLPEAGHRKKLNINNKPKSEITASDLSKTLLVQ